MYINHLSISHLLSLMQILSPSVAPPSQTELFNSHPISAPVKGHTQQLTAQINKNCKTLIIGTAHIKLNIRGGGRDNTLITEGWPATRYTFRRRETQRQEKGHTSRKSSHPTTALNYSTNWHTLTLLTADSLRHKQNQKSFPCTRTSERACSFSAS